MRKRKYPVTRKVQYGHYAMHRQAWKKFPVIHLGGFYLRDMDFNVGDIVNVLMAPGIIMITKA